MTTQSNRKKASKRDRRSLALAIAVTVSVILSGRAGLCSTELPTGEQLVSGAASVSRVGPLMQVSQTTDKAIINWQKFNIGSEAAVHFQQPGATSVALNRVLSLDPSKIDGTLTANGRVFLVNPSGIIFGKGSSVNVGGLVASTMSISDSDFNAGTWRFTRGSSTSSILNQGSITAADGGLVAFLGANVQNEGVIEARLGTTLLASGETATITFGNDNLYNVAVDPATVATMIDNKGIILADGGRVVMRASTASDLLRSVINTSGTVQARFLGEKNGVISIIGDMESGSAMIGGTLDASAPNSGNGGFIETSAANVRIADNTIITTIAPNGTSGTWLIDPHDFTIGSTKSGTVTAGTPSGDISGSTLSGALGLNNVTILSSQGSNAAGYGDINVNDAVSWSANTLTLNAARNININSVMTATGSSKLTLNSATANGSEAAVASGKVLVGLNSDGFLGHVDFDRSGTGFLTINGHPYNVVRTLSELSAIHKAGYQISAYYALGFNLDASSTATMNWDAATSTYKGFVPIANFEWGVFNGLGHVISGLYINRPNEDMVGLFGSIASNRPIDVSNLGMDVKTVGATTVGSITGRNKVGAIVSGLSDVGSVFDNVFNRLNVTGVSSVGGIIGYDRTPTINNSFNTGNIIGTGDFVGGIGGYGLYGPINNSYNTGDVTGGGSYTGGIVGYDHGNNGVQGCYNIGTVIGVTYVGGITGWVEATESNNYNTGIVKGVSDVGGLAGYNRGIISNSWSSGQVIRTSGSETTLGGMVGYLYYALGNSVWDKEASGITVGVGFDVDAVDRNYDSCGKTTAEMKSLATYSNWSISDSYDTLKIWRIYSGDTYPLLRWTLLTPTSNLTTGSVSKVYDKQVFSGTLTRSMDDLSTVPTGINFASSVTGAFDAGTYAVGLWSTIYDLNVTKGTLTISPKPLTVTATGLDKVYDGTKNGSATVSTTDMITGDNLGYTYSGLFDGKNVGTDKFLLLSNITLTGVSRLNYSLQNSSLLTTASITARPLTVTATGIDKEYNSTAVSSATLASTGKVSGDDLSYSYLSAQFADKNVGTDKVVTVSGISLSGTDLLNYSLQNTSAATTATITAKALQISGLTGVNREYDGTNNATLSGTSSISIFSGNDVTLGGTVHSTFADKIVGNDKAITVSGFTITGADAGNYILQQPSGLTANITRATLQLGGLTAQNKVYDTTTTASLSGTASISTFGTDDVSLSGIASATFADKNVGTAKSVTLTGLSISGADAAYYNLVKPSLTANITPCDLLVYGLTAKDKVYDATTAATLSGTPFIRAYSSDVVTLGGTAVGTFSDKNVGTEKTVTVTGNTISGTDAGNYTLIQQSGLTAEITKATLQITGLTAHNKVYDTTTSATISGTASVSPFTGDVVSVDGTAANASFTSKNVGTDKAVTVSGYAIDGTDAGNYNLLQQSGLRADVTVANLYVSGLTASDKIYDSSTTAIIVGAASITPLSDDHVTIDGTAQGNFADKNVGSGKSVTITGNTISGDDAANYVLIQRSDITADITKRDLPVYGLSAKNKQEDGTTAATLTGTATIMTFSGDDVTLGGTAAGTFAQSGAKLNLPVTVTGNTISGSDAGNYNLLQQRGLTADINPVPSAATYQYTGSTQSDNSSQGTGSTGSTGSPAYSINQPVLINGTGIDVRVNYQPVIISSTVISQSDQGTVIPLIN